MRSRLWDSGQEEVAAELVERGWKSQAELDERTAKATERAEAQAGREADREARATAKAAKAAKATESEAV